MTSTLDCTCVRAYIHPYVRVHVPLHVCVYVHVHGCVDVCVCVYVCLFCVHVYMSICPYRRTQMYTCSEYIHIYTYTYSIHIKTYTTYIHMYTFYRCTQVPTSMHNSHKSPAPTKSQEA